MKRRLALAWFLLVAIVVFGLIGLAAYTSEGWTGLGVYAGMAAVCLVSGWAATEIDR